MELLVLVATATALRVVRTNETTIHVRANVCFMLAGTNVADW
jgi:hypothetical protein